ALGVADAVVLVGGAGRGSAAWVDTLPVAQLDPPSQGRCRGSPGGVVGVGVWVCSAGFGVSGQFDQYRFPPAVGWLRGCDAPEFAGCDGDLDDAAAPRVAPYWLAAAGGRRAWISPPWLARPAGSQTTYRQWAAFMSATRWRTSAAGTYPQGGIWAGCSLIPSSVANSTRTSGAAHRVGEGAAIGAEALLGVSAASSVDAASSLAAGRPRVPPSGAPLLEPSPAGWPCVLSPGALRP
ncbi:MAG TPA: hypothetical protein VFZ63_02075, partial [Jiangellaceae bacterium]